MFESLESLTLNCRKLSIIDYQVDVHVGIYAQEKGHSQPVLFTVDVWVERSDTIKNYWDYTTIVKAINHLVASGRHIGLQEEIHDALLDTLFSDCRVKAARILTKKTKAVTYAAAAAVETFRINPNHAS